VCPGGSATSLDSGDEVCFLKKAVKGFQLLEGPDLPLTGSHGRPLAISICCVCRIKATM
jgi:hypothetical protein